MSKNTQLVIVESPTKAKTISKFLGKDYLVESSYGHVRDLPKSKLGIDVDHDFEPEYVIPKKSQKRVTELKKAVKKSSGVILATDEDREGEAIAWHLRQALDLPEAETKRIVFHEITKTAIEEALSKPRQLDVNLVDAQQARRVLDRLVGYKLSPFLWKKVRRGLSAGRVQSVALRLIVDREEEIKRFRPEEYWTLSVELKDKGGSFTAEVYREREENFPKPGLPEEKRVRTIAADLEKSYFALLSLEKKESRKNPQPPFTTSTLQQTSSRRLGYSAQKTMYLAQQLYENGYITYMRTDSVNLSQEALSGARSWIKSNLSAAYLPEAPRAFRNSSRLAQEAHEAIRPTRPEVDPESFRRTAKSKDQQALAKIYELIWRRTIASQMMPAVFDAVRAEIEAKGQKTYGLRATGNVLKFDGFLNVWPMKFEEKELPPLREGEKLELEKVLPERHETQPPPRYNEASLIKTLEQYGIGRPSTYAPIISVIQNREYVVKEQGRFLPTEIGTLVNSVLTENFSEIVDIQFTAKMEEELDQVAEGKAAWRNIIGEFYRPFAKHLAEKYEAVSKKELTEEKTDQVCEKCGKPMVIKLGRFGKFLACSGFPECRNTKSLKEPPKPTGITCPKCLADAERQKEPGELIERRVNKRGRARGKIFWGCNKYPVCDYAVWEDPTKVTPVFPLPEKKKTARGKKKETEEQDVRE